MTKETMVAIVVYDYASSSHQQMT